MSQPRFNIKFLLVTTLFTIIVTAVGVFMLFKQMPTQGKDTAVAAIRPSGENEGADRKILYWRAPMDPMEIYEEPGKSKMGMDLVPVYEDEVADATPSNSKDRKIAYWKAPMDPTEIYEQPGKSKMGMDLVPVYEDELVSGVDIKIDPVVEQNMGLKTERVKKEPLVHTIETYGNITYDETRTGIVSQKVDGWIETLHADFTGIPVRKGDPLYEVYSPALVAAQDEYLTAYGIYKKNPTPLNRELKLSARKRLAYFDIADTEIERIEKSGTAKKTLLVRSAFDGVVTHKNIVEGAFVKSGANLFTISDLRHVWAEAHIFEYEQNLVKVGQKVEMTLSYNPQKVYKGNIAYIYPYLQPKTRDVVIRIHIENDDLVLKPDMFANIKIKADAGKEVLSISSEAVIHSGKKQIVFVQKEKGKFSAREIKTGIRMDDGSVQVVSGLSGDDLVVTSGQFLLDSESRMKEAIQKMIRAKSGETGTGSGSNDAFFEDMETESDDAFFEDMG